MGTVPWNMFVIPACAGMTSFKMASSWVSLDIHTMTRHAR